MKLSKQEYQKLYEKASPPSPSYKNIPIAFLVGGLLCVIGQGFRTLYENAGLSEQGVAAAVAISMVAIGVVLTALGVYDKIAKHAGAGTLVPITGFANSVASPALEFKTEGMILGTCVKMFTIAGPVLVLGVSASVLYGLILVIFGG
ncbi:MAG TPA: stage V sporulation protein AC [Candidatus Ventrousia excrementavium]|uniref:Stage V sporulation protein AC n=1 Tax=Candidatus Ventrousia excrementavium TaxID=2840961 RepID=A0A9D1LKM0_9CLOT|nr:stage V sporulation protein AC [Candidatus Ventrousia excrementavium]